MSLFIGAFFPESELSDSPFSKALTNIAAKLASLQAQKTKEPMPLIDLRFMIPGKTDKPDFTGMRYNSFDKISQTLRIDSCVPEAMIESEKAEKYIVAAMQDATENASSFFHEENIEFNEFWHLQVLNDLGNKLAEAV